MKRKVLSVFSILIGCMSFPVYAEDQPRVYGQPVAPAAAQTSAAAQPPAAAQPSAAVQPPAAAQTSTANQSPVAAQSHGAAQPVSSISGSADAQTLQQQPANKSRLTFMDSKLFDMRLGKELESGKDIVEVDVSGRVSLSNIPPRIDKWVVRSAEEGKVELLPSEPAPKTRFLFSLIPMVFNAFGAYKNMQEEKMFDHAKNYDTKIYYKKDDAGETLIEKIVMTRRKN